MVGPTTVRALWWAERAARQTRRDLAADRLDDLVVTMPPPLPEGDRRWVAALLRVRRQTCLVQSAVLQAWDASHGQPRDLVIGVTAPSDGFRAHAWLEGDPASRSRGFSELSRRPAPAIPGAPTRRPHAQGQVLSGEASTGDSGDQAVE